MVRFEGVGKVFKETGTSVFSDVSFHLPMCGMMLVTGESGSGKTTLMRLLMKEIEADAGRIYVNGQDIRTIKKSGIPGYRRRIGFVFQNLRLLADRSVYENVALARQVAGVGESDIRSEVTAALKLVGLDCVGRRYPEQLSGGQQAKVCIARAIVGNPPLLLADEPTGNLDYKSSREIMLLLERIQKRGTAVLIATHDRQAAAGLSCPCLRLDEGSAGICAIQAAFGERGMGE